MTTYYVRKVRKQRAADGHEHIVGVITTAEIFYSNQQVVSSLNTLDRWYTDVAGEPKAAIKAHPSCNSPSCNHKPYLKTDGDRSQRNNLENLPRG